MPAQGGGAEPGRSRGLVPEQQTNTDVVVVGAGVIGLACAWRAAQRGLDVVVVDRATPAAGATGVAAGMLAPVGELEFGEQRLLEMTLESSRRYPDFVAELEERSGEQTGFDRCGALHVALDRDEAEGLRRRHDLQISLGLDAEWLTPSRCRELEPGLSPSIAGGGPAPGDGAIDPRALCAALLAALEQGGVEVRSCAAAVAARGLPAAARSGGAGARRGERGAGAGDAGHPAADRTGCTGRAHPRQRPLPKRSAARPPDRRSGGRCPRGQRGGGVRVELNGQ